MTDWLIYLKNGLSRKLPEDRIAGRQPSENIRTNLDNLRPYVSKRWRQALMGLMLIFSAVLLGFPSPLITKYLVDQVILPRRLDLLALPFAFLALVLLAEKLVGVFEEFFFARIEQQITLEIQRDLIARALRFPKRFFDNHAIGYLMSRLSEDVEGLRWFFSKTFIHTVSNMVRFAGGVGFLVYLEWRLSVIVLILLPGLAFLIRFVSDKFHILSHHSMEQRAHVASSLQESLSSSGLIKAFASEERTLNRIMEDLRSLLNISLEQTTVSLMANLIINAMPGLARAVALVVGGYWIIQGKWTLGGLLAFQAYLAYVFGPAQFLASANLQLQRALAALERVSGLFDVIPEENTDHGSVVDKLNGEVEFEAVSFAYDPQNPLLQDISFHIRPGERIAIIGPSGAGKTTLVSLLLGFYRPTCGEIRFDSRPMAGLKIDCLRRRIGYVSQLPHLMSGTIRENLCYGDPNAGEHQIVEAAEVAGIHDFIIGLPHGYQTRLAENGVNLSEGQKQRIALARALVKDPDILVLDEPAAALDQRTERSIFSALPEAVKGKTLIVIAHRLSTIRDADRILMLADTRLTEVGSAESLRGSDMDSALRN
jgi:subfamily B ATP-binding cassette protein MsbA